MLLTNLRFSLRHLMRQRFNTTLHVIGLTLAMSVCLLIGVYLRFELSFDNHHENAQRIYRVNSVWKESDKQFNLYATPLQLAEAIRNEVSGLDKVTMSRPLFKSVVEISPQKIFKQEHMLVIEPDFLNIFNIEVLRGDPSALDNPYQALLNQTTAVRYFGNDDPVGKTFTYRNKFIITVAGVFKDIPSTTHLPASILLSYAPDEEFLANGDTWYFGESAWAKLSASTYILLADNADANDVQAQLKAIADKNINADPTLDQNIHGDFVMQKLSDIHFDTIRFGGGPWVPAANTSWLWFFGGLGIAVLLLACINFLNLSTAQALARSREVGVRKAIGARRSHILWQFLTDAFVIVLVSGVLAMFVSQISISQLNTLLDKQVSFNPFQYPELAIAFLLFILVTSLLAGIYPAWFVSRFNPVAALKSGSSGNVVRASWLRKALVVSQFSISAGLLIAVLLIARQAEYFRDADLGFEKENIVSVEVGDHDKLQGLANELLQIPGVKDVSFSRTSPISDDHWWNTIGVTETTERKSVCAIYADDHFFSVYGLRLISGRVPQVYKNSPADLAVKQQPVKVIVNESLLRELKMGTPMEAIGKHFWWGGDAEVSGVVADFNMEPLKYGISPALIIQDEEVYSHANIRLESIPNRKITLSTLEQVWKKHFPDGVYEYALVENQIESYYASEHRLYTLFRIFAGLAILISCLGLWGLVTYSAHQRAKEISVRKVLGASVKSLLILLTTEYFMMVFVAFLIASPLTYYFMNEWLSNFAFHIEIGWDTFLVAGLWLIVFAGLTVSIQVLTAALKNPVRSLKSE